MIKQVFFTKPRTEISKVLFQSFAKFVLLNEDDQLLDYWSHIGFQNFWNWNCSLHCFIKIPASSFVLENRLHLKRLCNPLFQTYPWYAEVTIYKDSSAVENSIIICLLTINLKPVWISFFCGTKKEQHWTLLKTPWFSIARVLKRFSLRYKWIASSWQRLNLLLGDMLGWYISLQDPEQTFLKRISFPQEYLCMGPWKCRYYFLPSKCIMFLGAKKVTQKALFNQYIFISLQHKLWNF